MTDYVTSYLSGLMGRKKKRRGDIYLPSKAEMAASEALKRVGRGAKRVVTGEEDETADAVRKFLSIGSKKKER